MKQAKNHAGGKRQREKIALELGGKNPNIVFQDADLETAADQALNAVFFHAGQVCSAGSRLLVDEAIHDEFLAELIKRTKRIKLGNGFHEDTESGPLISAEHRAKVEKYVEIGIEEGQNWKQAANVLMIPPFKTVSSMNLLFSQTASLICE